ncbi:hypothetical protein K402DRAFT_404712 [Aulographum hederae CBS 113979]|uniref:Uncharacterized protein n=1 Tax=Aulographum hederae CBS 113979 TaxID=1176131 RepID=A0A6G1GYV6_9PEZI|nr:hypothetical protein K402DRAFT_404712 [Aulographum hederae CBS 113979]
MFTSPQDKVYIITRLDFDHHESDANTSNHIIQVHTSLPHDDDAAKKHLRAEAKRAAYWAGPCDEFFDKTHKARDGTEGCYEGGATKRNETTAIIFGFMKIRQDVVQPQEVKEKDAQRKRQRDDEEAEDRLTLTSNGEAERNKLRTENAAANTVAGGERSTAASGSHVRNVIVLD